jgi:hypothetical protein
MIHPPACVASSRFSLRLAAIRAYQIHQGERAVIQCGHLVGEHVQNFTSWHPHLLSAERKSKTASTEERRVIVLPLNTFHCSPPHLDSRFHLSGSEVTLLDLRPK